MAANALNTIYRFAIPLAAGFGLAQASLYDVKGGNRAIIFDRLSGVREGVVNEGTHFLIPWLQKAIVYDVRTKPRNISTTTGSKDLQMVSLTLRVLHRPEVSKLSTIYQVCDASYRDSDGGNHTDVYCRILAKTTTSVSFPPSETKSLRLSSHNLTPPSSSPSVKLSQIAFAQSF